jgi:hypothetical protein
MNDHPSIRDSLRSCYPPEWRQGSYCDEMNLYEEMGIDTLPREKPMSESVYLHGAEDVRSAGNAIASAADEIRHAANLLDESLHTNQRAMEEWLDRLRVLLSDEREALVKELGEVLGPFAK